MSQLGHNTLFFHILRLPAWAFHLLLRLIDLCLISLAFAAAAPIQSIDLLQDLASPSPVQIQSSLYLIVFLCLWLLLAGPGSFLDSTRHRPFPALLRDLLGRFALVLIFFLASCAILDFPPLNLLRLGLFLGFVLLLLGIERYFLYRLLQYVRNKGHNLRTILIVGSTARAKQLIQSIIRHSGAGYRIIGCLDDDPEKAGRDLVQGVKVIGGLKDLPQILQHKSVDELIFTQPDQDFQGAETAIARAEEQGITVRFILDEEEAEYTSDG